MESVIAGLQAPELPPVTLLQVTVTAEAGTVAQPVNDAAAACTLRFHVLLVDPPEVVQLMVEEALPETLPRSGSVAVKLIVPGLAVGLKTLVANGITRPAAGATTWAFCWAADTWAALTQTQSTKALFARWSCSADRIGNGRRIRACLICGIVRQGPRSGGRGSGVCGTGARAKGRHAGRGACAGRLRAAAIGAGGSDCTRVGQRIASRGRRPHGRPICGAKVRRYFQRQRSSSRGLGAANFVQEIGGATIRIEGCSRCRQRGGCSGHLEGCFGTDRHGNRCGSSSGELSVDGRAYYKGGCRYDYLVNSHKYS